MLSARDRSLTVAALIIKGTNRRLARIVGAWPLAFAEIARTIAGVTRRTKRQSPRAITGEN